MRLELHVIAQYSLCVFLCVEICFMVDHHHSLLLDPSPSLPQVVIQHGGRVLEEYDPEQCTHLLALHKKSEVFAKASRDTAWNEANSNWLLLHKNS